MELTFIECDVCAKKAGSPDLCKSCVNNRDMEYQFIKKIRNLQDKLKIIEDIIELE